MCSVGIHIWLELLQVSFIFILSFWKMKTERKRPWKPIKPQQRCPFSGPCILNFSSWCLLRQCTEEQTYQAAWHVHPNINFQERVCSSPGLKNPSLSSYFVNFSSLEGFQLVEELCSLTVSWGKYSWDMNPYSPSITQMHSSVFTKRVPYLTGSRALSRKISCEGALLGTSFFSLMFLHMKSSNRVRSALAPVPSITDPMWWLNGIQSIPFAYFFLIPLVAFTWHLLSAFLSHRRTGEECVDKCPTQVMPRLHLRSHSLVLWNWY